MDTSKRCRCKNIDLDTALVWVAIALFAIGFVLADSGILK
jgi:hypothetical protein